MSDYMPIIIMAACVCSSASAGVAVYMFNPFNLFAGAANAAGGLVGSAGQAASGILSGAGAGVGQAASGIGEGIGSAFKGLSKF